MQNGQKYKGQFISKTHYTVGVTLIKVDRTEVSTISMSIEGSQDIHSRWIIVPHNKLLLWSMNYNCNVELIKHVTDACKQRLWPSKQCSLYSPARWMKSWMLGTLVTMKDVLLLTADQWEMYECLCFLIDRNKVDMLFWMFQVEKRHF